MSAQGKRAAKVPEGEAGAGEAAKRQKDEPERITTAGQIRESKIMQERVRPKKNRALLVMSCIVCFSFCLSATNSCLSRSFRFQHHLPTRRSPASLSTSPTLILNSKLHKFNRTSFQFVRCTYIHTSRVYKHSHRNPTCTHVKSGSTSGSRR